MKESLRLPYIDASPLTDPARSLLSSAISGGRPGRTIPEMPSALPQKIGAETRRPRAACENGGAVLVENFGIPFSHTRRYCDGQLCVTRLIEPISLLHGSALLPGRVRLNDMRTLP
jgi:hypothetical protein